MLTTSVNERELQRMGALPIAGRVSKPLTREKMDLILQQYLPG